MKNTDFSSVKSSINDKTEKTHMWVCTYVDTFANEEEKEDTSLMERL